MGEKLSQGMRIGSLVAAAAGAAVLLLARSPVAGQEGAASPASDPLAARGWAVTGGAAPGYVDDRACASCHRDLAESYREVAMSRSFYRPHPSRAIERFEDPFHHPASGRSYEMSWRDDRLLFRRWRLDDEGRQVDVYEREVDWVLGSGEHARTYLYQVPSGELYQLPIAWYSQSGEWAMAPGFDKADHDGVGRDVRRECMACHNAFPDVPAGSDLHAEPNVFPAELPSGIGCQRCHGPGAEHARLALADEVDFERMTAAIVDPLHLEPARRDDVCDQCHLQPTVAVASPRRFGRGDYSFRPGDDLADHLVQIDVDEAGLQRGDRFEINHHAYRLYQSRCHLESEPGALACITCHDPHRKVPAAERAAHYRRSCEGCHEVDACALEAMNEETRGELALPTEDAGDCAACHMSKRRPTDVVRVVMTDHLIRRRPGGPELIAPIEETDPTLVGIKLYDPERAPGGALGEVYRSATLARAGSRDASVVRYLSQQLDLARPEAVDPYLDLAAAQLGLRLFPAAERTLLWVLDRSPGRLEARERLAVARFGLGDVERSIEELRALLEEDPSRVEARFNLGRILLAADRPEPAAEALREALARRPNLVAAWRYLGDALLALERRDEALESYREALAIAPDDADVRARLETALLEGEPAEPRS